ncbi:MAG: META domain-containing protein [Candidatus Promineifilaceae bacterium]
MKKFRLVGLLLLLSTIVLAACDVALPGTEPEADQSEASVPYPVDEGAETSNAGLEKTIFVGPELVDCVGVGPQQCLMVKEDPNGEYMMHYDPIEGFNFEPGYEYELIILEETVENPPADGSSLKWTLLQEVSRTPVESTPDTGSETASGRIVTAFVGPELVDCEGGAGPQQCMQYKASPDESYRLFYDTIDGFEFQPGYEYELSVLVEPVENPPADGSALRYTLIEVISQTPVTAEQPMVGESEPSGALNLEGQPWLLTSFVDPAGQQAEALADTRVTIAFNNGEVSGSGGCNNYFGTYQLNGSSLTLSPMGSTMMACVPDDIMTQETAYFAMLGQVVSYEIVEGQLHLQDMTGQTIAVFEADTNISLIGTEWQAIGYNNGTGGVQSLVLGSEITAVFSESGLVSGSAGCNDYRASFQVEGNNMTISPAAVTRKICPEPEGAMEQEALYLAALEQAATYEVTGPRLDIYDADGARLANFTAGDTVASEEGTGEAGAASVAVPVAAGGDSNETAAYPGEIDAAATTEPSEQSALPAAETDVLADTSWQWLSMTTPVEEVTVEDPAAYVISFLEENQIGIQADCNSGAGTYEAGESTLTINITSTTLALCPEGSLSDLFIRSLNAAAIHFEMDGNLHIDLFADAGTMIFAPNEE